MAESETGNNTEFSENTSSGSSSKLSSEEREVIIIMNDKDRKWEASCSSPTYMRKFDHKAGHALAKIIIAMVRYVQSIMRHQWHLQSRLVKLRGQNVKENL